MSVLLNSIISKYSICLILLFTILFSLSNSQQYGLKCLKKKTKTKGICAIYRNNTVEERQTLFIFNKCKSDEKCSLSKYDNLYICKKNPKLKKIGKKCKFDIDCLTNKCNPETHKCTWNLIDGVCGNGYGWCEMGSSCLFSKDKNIKKCVKDAGPGEKCGYDGNNIIANCKAGYICEQGVCSKIGGLKEGTLITDGYKAALCDTGIARKYNGQYKCARLKSVSQCMNNIANVTWYKENNFNNETEETKEQCDKFVYLSDGTKKQYVKGISTAKIKAWENFIENFKSLDLDDINKDKDYYSTNYEPDENLLNLKGRIDKKLFEKFIVYRNAEIMENMGILGKGGKAKKGKKCEYQYYIKRLN